MAVKVGALSARTACPAGVTLVVVQRNDLAITRPVDGTVAVDELPTGDASDDLPELTVDHHEVTGGGLVSTKLNPHTSDATPTTERSQPVACVPKEAVRLYVRAHD